MAALALLVELVELVVGSERWRDELDGLKESGLRGGWRNWGRC